MGNGVSRVRFFSFAVQICLFDRFLLLCLFVPYQPLTFCYLRLTYVMLFHNEGNGGYLVGSSDESNKHYMTCVGANGTTTQCLMSPGDLYISCIDDCTLQKCENEESQRDCSALEGQKKSACEDGVTWCPSYEIKTITEEDEPRGFIPLLDICIDKKGLPSQELGEIYKSHDGDAENCYYDDKVTLVNRNLSGNYSYCATENAKDSCLSGGSSLSCNGTFVGAFRQWNYDPRYR